MVLPFVNPGDSGGRVYDLSPDWLILSDTSNLLPVQYKNSDILSEAYTISAVKARSSYLPFELTVFQPNTTFILVFNVQSCKVLGVNFG